MHGRQSIWKLSDENMSKLQRRTRSAAPYPGSKLSFGLDNHFPERRIDRSKTFLPARPSYPNTSHHLLKAKNLDGTVLGPISAAAMNLSSGAKVVSKFQP